MHQFDLKNRTAIITGGAQGFGLDIARKFLNSGANVIIWDIDEKELQNVVKKINNPKLAYNLDPVILPVGITGTAHLKGLFRVFNPSGSITVTIGRPFRINKTSGLTGEKGFFKDLTYEMMLRISELLPPEKRGVYKDITIKDYLLTENC